MDTEYLRDRLYTYSPEWENAIYYVQQEYSLPLVRGLLRYANIVYRTGNAHLYVGGEPVTAYGLYALADVYHRYGDNFIGVLGRGQLGFVRDTFRTVYNWLDVPPLRPIELITVLVGSSRERPRMGVCGYEADSPSTLLRMLDVASIYGYSSAFSSECDPGPLMCSNMLPHEAAGNDPDDHDDLYDGSNEHDNSELGLPPLVYRYNRGITSSPSSFLAELDFALGGRVSQQSGKKASRVEEEEEYVPPSRVIRIRR